MSVLIRKARRSDKVDIMSFVKDIWRGHDYIPYVWDQWMSDKNGQMFVAEVDGRAVGMNRIRFMADGSAWLEGVRIDPDYRRRGLATLLGMSSMKFARSLGFRTFRLTSAATNKPVHGQVRKMGFASVARMTIYSAKAKARFRPPKAVRRARLEESRQVWESIRRSPEYSLGGGVYWDGFAATTLNLETLARKIREGSVYLVGGGVAIARRGGEGTENWRQVCFASGPEQDVTRLLRYIFGRKERFRSTWRVVYATTGSPLVKSLTRAGLRRGHSFLLFQRDAAKS